MLRTYFLTHPVDEALPRGYFYAIKILRESLWFGVEQAVVSPVASLFRDGSGSSARRLARLKHGAVRLLSIARFSVVAPAKAHPFAEAVPAGDRQGRCLCKSPVDPDPID